MPLLPIADAIPIVRKAVYAALSPLCGSFNGTPKCYWEQSAVGATLPLLVFHEQSAGGLDASKLGLGGWTGLITVKALASSPTAADAQLSGVAAALDTMTNPTGYTLQATIARSLTQAPLDSVFTTGLIFRIFLYRA